MTWTDVADDTQIWTAISHEDDYMADDYCISDYVESYGDWNDESDKVNTWL